MHRRFTQAAASIAFLVAAAGADNVLSNQHIPVGSGTSLSGTAYKAASFEFAPGQDYLLRSVTLTMNFAGGGTPQVSIWSGTGPVPVTLLQVLQNPTTTGSGEFTFTVPVSTSLILRANTKYWVHVTRTAGTSFTWEGTNPQTAPTGVADSMGFVLSGTQSNTSNRFRVDALPVVTDNFGGTSPGAGTVGSTFQKEGGWTNTDDQAYLFRGVTTSVDCFTGAAPVTTVWRGVTPQTTVTAWISSTQTGQFDLLAITNSLHTQAAGESMWVRMHNDGGPAYHWRGTNPSGTNPTGPHAQALGYRLNGVTSGVTNRFAALAQPIIADAGDRTPESGGSLLDLQRRKACSFSTPAGNQGRLQYVRLPLDTSSGAIPVVSIWRGANQPQAFLAQLQDPEVVGTHATYSEIQFRARNVVPLAPGNTYWVVVQSANDLDVRWLANDDSDNIAHGLAYGGQFLFSIDAGANWDDSTTTNAFMVIGPGTASCRADLSGSSDPANPAYGVPDGSADASDFFYFLDRFAAGDVSVADLTQTSDPADPMYGVPDGLIDASDFFFYLDLFTAGCP